LSSKIGEAFRRFGVADNTKDLLVLKVATTPAVTLESVSQHLEQNIQGNEVAFQDSTFRKISDIPRIRKIYKLGSTAPAGRTTPSMDGGSGSDAIYEVKDIETQVLGLMALRGAT
jgi:EKC/KEOPS complex subunit CGI121/TPRKB